MTGGGGGEVDGGENKKHVDVEIESHGFSLLVTAALLVLFVVVLLKNGALRNWYIAVIDNVRKKFS